jgi:hypothetical protein
MKALTTSLWMLLLGFTPTLSAGTLFFSGNLRTDASVVDCGVGCTLGPSDTDGAFAQFAAVVNTFNLPSTSTVTVITYGYGGGTSLTGPAVAPGGLEPYLSLFDGAGNFLVSSDASGCPPGAGTIDGNCFDVLLDAGTLGPGTYQLALTAWHNLSFAENLGAGTLADGFTGLGNLGAKENLNYAYDLVIQSTTVNAPEPGSAGLLLVAGGALCAYTTYRKKLKG